jgi:hypothetical protein
MKTKQKTKPALSLPALLDVYRNQTKESVQQHDGPRFHPKEAYTGDPEFTRTRRKLQENNDAELTPMIDEEPEGPRRKMFPYDLWPTLYYYKYKGSLTYPPCSENARWRIFDAPLRISRRQYKQLASLLESYKDEATLADDGLFESASAVSPTGENVRPLFDLNTDDQTLAHCTFRRYRYWDYDWDQQ